MPHTSVGHHPGTGAPRESEGWRSKPGAKSEVTTPTAGRINEPPRGTAQEPACPGTAYGPIPCGQRGRSARQEPHRMYRVVTSRACRSHSNRTGRLPADGSSRRLGLRRIQTDAGSKAIAADGHLRRRRMRRSVPGPTGPAARSLRFFPEWQFPSASVNTTLAPVVLSARSIIGSNWAWLSGSGRRSAAATGPPALSPSPLKVETTAGR